MCARAQQISRGDKEISSKLSFLDAPKWHFAVYCEGYTPWRPMGSGRVTKFGPLYNIEALELNLKTIGKRHNRLLVEIWW